MYNQQRSVFGGEETVIANTTTVLRKHGHEVVIAMRSSRGIERSLLSKVTAGLGGIYSISAATEMKQRIASERPDVVHVHSIYPMWSPSIFRACKRMGVPTVLHVHCHYLTCPNWYHLRKGQVCERCLGGKEYSCLLKNCRGSLVESAAYFLRSYIARRFGLVSNNVTLFVTVSDFLKQRLTASGFPNERIAVLPNVVLDASVPGHGSESGDYIGYCGRLSEEKGLSVLLEAARLTGLPVRVAGEGPERSALEQAAPPNVTFLGHLNRDDLHNFYVGCRFLVLPSLSFEGFPMAAVESMMLAKCVVASRIGAIPEVVRDGRNGLLFKPGDSGELSRLMQALWSDVELCRTFGIAAHSDVQLRCTEDKYYNGLLAIYHRAILTPTSL